MTKTVKPPRFTIDLSLPPRDRYREVARAYKGNVKTLTPLFDEIARDAGLSPTLARKLAALCLRGLNRDEETEELKGIAEETGTELYLLVALNVLLDLFMGCTSGGVRVHEASGRSRMLHYRSLDVSTISVPRT